ncbi:iron-containing alcohol dehydrogenase [Glaciecola sp. 33A]|uniref:iron-containing alcohol dehydrogenase n=1 Tax=Glaciecola sp. 33A TaxID=2057807 RepID=UPI003518C2D7
MDEQRIVSVIFDKTQPDPTISNVNDGLALLKQHDCDFVVSLGGGSPHDCAKGVVLPISQTAICLLFGQIS